MSDAASPLVSVVIPVHNRSDLAPSAVESALSQDITDLEIIVVDDGSTDDLQERLEPYLDQIRMITQTRSGPGAARNRGIEAARGRFVAFLDADDVWLPDKLSVLTGLLDSHPSLRWASSNHFVERDGRTGVRLPPGDINSEDLVVVDDWFESYGKTVSTTTSGVVIERTVLKEIGGFDESVLSGHDYDLWFRLAIRHPKLGYCKRPLFRYRANLPGSISRAGMFDHKYRILERHIEWERGRGTDDARRRRVVRQGLKFVRRCLATDRRQLASNMAHDLRPLVSTGRYILMFAAVNLPGWFLRLLKSLQPS